MTRNIIIIFIIILVFLQACEQTTEEPINDSLVDNTTILVDNTTIFVGDEDVVAEDSPVLANTTEKNETANNLLDEMNTTATEPEKETVPDLKAELGGAADVLTYVTDDLTMTWVFTDAISLNPSLENFQTHLIRLQINVPSKREGVLSMTKILPKNIVFNSFENWTLKGEINIANRTELQHLSKGDDTISFEFALPDIAAPYIESQKILEAENLLISVLQKADFQSNHQYDFEECLAINSDCRYVDIDDIQKVVEKNGFVFVDGSFRLFFISPEEIRFSFDISVESLGEMWRVVVNPKTGEFDSWRKFRDID